MKRSLLISFFLLGRIMLFAQLPGNYNLVSNGRLMFEFDNLFNDTTFSNSSCWIPASRGYTSVASTSKGYYDTTTRSFIPVPDDTGYTGRAIILSQNPFDYNIPTRQIDTNINGSLAARMYAENRLREPLVAGRTYKFTMYVTEITYSAYVLATVPLRAYVPPSYSTIKNLGVYFSVNKIMQNNNKRINVTPQLNFRGWNPVKSDTTEMVALSGTYTAMGGEQYITIGNFDYAKDFVLGITDWPSWAPDSISFNNTNRINDISLVSDTTLPMINPSAFSLGNDTTICPGSSLTIGGDPYFAHYWWNTGDTTRQINIHLPGTYWCTVDYGCGNYTDTIKVLPITTLTSFKVSDTVICPGSSVYTAYLPADAVSYEWSTGARTRSVTITTPGKYWARVQNTCGGYLSDTFTVAAAPSVIPGININSIPPSTLCAGAMITFITNNAGAGSSPRYQWYKNGNPIAGAVQDTYTDGALRSGDTLTVAMYSSASCPVTQPTISNKMGVTVYPEVFPSVAVSVSPAGTIYPGQPVTFQATGVSGGAAPRYQWLLNGNPVAGANRDSWTTSRLRNGDQVSVQMESGMYCAIPPIVKSREMIIELNATGVGTAINQPTAYKVYPNPAKEKISFDLSKPAQHASISIYDSYGRLAVTAEAQHSQKLMLDVMQMPAGIYFYRLTVDGNVFNGKIVKE